MSLAVAGRSCCCWTVERVVRSCCWAVELVRRSWSLAVELGLHSLSLAVELGLRSWCWVVGRRCCGIVELGHRSLSWVAGRKCCFLGTVVGLHSWYVAVAERSWFYRPATMALRTGSMAMMTRQSCFSTEAASKSCVALVVQRRPQPTREWRRLRTGVKRSRKWINGMNCTSSKRFTRAAALFYHFRLFRNTLPADFLTIFYVKQRFATFCLLFLCFLLHNSYS